MAKFAEVATVAEELAGTASRLKKRAAIERALLAAHQSAEGIDGARSSALFCLYLAGQPFAEADPRKLNAGGALLSRALLAVSGATDAGLTAAYRRHGDLGAAAHDLLVAPYGKAPAQATLTLEDVAAAFEAMAVARSTASRAALVEDLLRRSTALEAKYLLKLMLGDMRIGVKQSLVEEAIAGAATAFGTPADVAAVRHAVMLEADLGRAVERAFAGTLGEARMKLFHPLGFMLASPVETPEEAVARFSAPPAKPAPKPAKKGRKKKAAQQAPRESAEEGFAEDVQAEAEAHRTADLSTALLQERQNSAEDASQGRGTALAFLEDKYDGMRAQVHCGDPQQPGRVAIYSRNREDITQSFPDLAEAFAKIDEPPGGLIFDGEILGWDYAGGDGHGSAGGALGTASGQALPFAVMGQRIGRKVVSNELRTQIPAVFMAFDLLFERGELLLPLPLAERRARLEEVVARWREQAVSPLTAPAEHTTAQPGLFATKTPLPAQKERLLLSPARRVADAEAIDQAYREARERKNEGVMLKAANSAYLPGRRGLAWVKLKRELATLDVVITGAEFGHGKRAAFLSDYTFAVRGEHGELLNVGKAYSGVTDAEIAELTEWLKAHTLEDHGHFRTVEPQIVLEVAFNNIMRSTRHASGFAMRFPRIVRVRTDKPVSEIDTLARVEEVYQSQPDRPEEALDSGA